MCLNISPACMYVHITCVPGVCRGQKWALELELQMCMSHHVGAVNRTWVLRTSSKCSKPLNHLSSPKPLKHYTGSFETSQFHNPSPLLKSEVLHRDFVYVGYIFIYCIRNLKILNYQFT